QSTPPQAGGTIIPYASGLVPLTLTAVLGTTAGVAAAVGFGGNVPIASFLGGLIDTSDILVLDYTVPRDGTITDIYANFNITAELDIGLGLEAVVQATLYRAPQGTNDF